MRIKKKKFEKMSIILAIGLILTIFLISKLKIVGYIGFAVILAVLGSNLINRRKISFDALFISISIYIIIIFIRFVSQSMYYTSSLSNVLNEILLLLLTLFVLNSRVSVYIWNKAFLIYAYLIEFVAIFLFITNQLEESSFFGTMYGNLLFVAFLIISLQTKSENRKFSIFCLIINMFMSWFAEMRSAVIAEAIMVFMMFWIGKFQKKKKNLLLIYGITVVICFFVPYVYMLLYNATTGSLSEISMLLVTYVRKYTGANFYSGRNRLWPYVLDAVGKRVLFGYGIGFTPSYLFNTTWSTHNLFLFCRMEYGIVGLMAFLNVLYQICKKYLVSKVWSPKVAFVVSLLIQQTFSLGLMSGKPAFAVPCWILLAVLTKEEKDNASGSRRVI